MSWYLYGLLAALFLGIYNFLYGFLNKNLGVSSILIGIGIGIVLFGFSIGIFTKGYSLIFSKYWLFSIFIGIILSLGIFFVVKSFSDPRVKISLLVPLINTNTLVSVLLGLIVLREYQSVSLVKVVIGTALILLGAIVIK